MVGEVVDPAAAEASYRKMLTKVTEREGVIKTEWLDHTKEIYEIYEGGKSDTTPFNILYSNTEVLVPNLFSSAPKAIVRRRFGESRSDAPAKAAERMAEYCLDTNIAGYPDFVDAVEAAVLDAALPGQGQCRVRIVNGIPCLDYVQHTDFIWGYAKRWEDVPWIAYRHDKTLEDAVREFSIPDEVAAQMRKDEESSGGNEGKKGPDTSPYYEVWNKQSSKVCFLSDKFPGVCVQEMEDPLHLTNFFPSIKPLRLLSTPVSTMPRATYELYRQQARELNLITERIRKVASAIQVRGLFDGNISELATIFTSGNAENELIATSNPATMMRDGGLDKHIWLIPIEKFVVVLQTLYAVRDQIKATIYEILGIGDILRGVTQASETASAQQIKDKWGSLRIKKSREKVSTFVRGYVRMLIEAAADHTPEDVWAQVTGLDYLTSVQAQAVPQQPPIPGAPPPPISWPDVLGTLRNDMTRSYVIDIETNSTVDGAATEDKEEVTEFMNALGQAMTGLEGLAAAGPEGFEASKTMLVEICKRFRMGSELQGMILKMKPPPKGATPEQEQMDKALEQKKGEAEQGQEQLKTAVEQAQAQFTQQQDQLKQMAEGLLEQQRKIKEEQAALAEQASELELRFREMQLELQGKQLELKAATTQLGQEVGKAQLDLQGKEQTLQSKEQSLKIQQSAEPPAPAAAAPEADKATSAAIEAIAAQGKVLETLLQTLANPPKMVIKKTGPATFERTSS